MTTEDAMPAQHAEAIGVGLFMFWSIFSMDRANHHLLTNNIVSKALEQAPINNNRLLAWWSGSIISFQAICREYY